MLQAADLIAWHYRHCNEIRKGFNSAAIHRASLPLLKDGIFRDKPRDEFVAQVGGLFKEHGVKWNQEVLVKMAEEDRRREEKRARGQAWRQGMKRP